MSKTVMEQVNNSNEQMGVVQQRDRKSKKKPNEYPQEKKNPQHTKNKQKHVIPKMKTSFSGLTSKLDTAELKIAELVTAALFARVKTWKQPKLQFTDEWIQKMKCIYTMEYHSPIK